MLLKKIALIGSTFIASVLPVLASADLVTVNNTNEPSSVRIVSTGLCPTRVTPAHQTLTTSQGLVQTLCGGRKSGPCTANVFASGNCGAPQAGVVTIDLSSLNVTVNQSMAPFAIVANGSTVTISCTKPGAC